MHKYSKREKLIRNIFMMLVLLVLCATGSQTSSTWKDVFHQTFTHRKNRKQSESDRRNERMKWTTYLGARQAVRGRMMKRVLPRLPLPGRLQLQ
jgi:hypothetical protein